MIDPQFVNEWALLGQNWYRAEEAAFAEYWKTVDLPQDSRVAGEMAGAAWVAWLVSAMRHAPWAK